MIAGTEDISLAAHHGQLEVSAENRLENFENRAALVGAEIAGIEGRVLDAEHFYEAAIRSAHANGFVHNKTVASELAARFYMARLRQDRTHAFAGRESTYGDRSSVRSNAMFGCAQVIAGASDRILCQFARFARPTTKSVPHKGSI